MFDAPLLNGAEDANFSQQRATEYSKGATLGNWNDVWSSFEKGQKVNVNPATTTNEDDGEDMSAKAGIAAE